MSKIVVNLGNEPEAEEEKTFVKQVDAPKFLEEHSAPKNSGKWKKILGIVGISLGVILLVGAIGGFFYWQSLKSTPQYSLALLVDAARRDDQKAIDELVDTDAVIDDFMPQVTAKAIELYGRNMPPAQILKVQQQATPYMPAIKDRARIEVPGLIREKTKPFESFPFWAIAVGAKRYMDIPEEGENATVKSKIPERQLELTMKKKGGKWQVVAIRDEVLAQRIAEKIGQEMIAGSKDGTLEKNMKKTNGKSFEDLKKSIEDIFK
ncbi:MAG: hypothetical protein ABWZ66_07120 [Pyrinomonadaceae bacterium]